MNLRFPFRSASLNPNADLEKWLISKDPAKQELADATLAAMGEDTRVKYLSHLMKRERDKGMVRVMVSSLALALLFGIFIEVSDYAQPELHRSVRLFHAGTFPYYAFFVFNVFARCISGMFGMLWLVNKIPFVRSSRLERAVLLRAAALNDLRLLPGLVDALPSSEPVGANGAKVVTQTIRSALYNLLPRLTPNDRDLLTDVQWTSLLSRLSRFMRRRNPELARAVLHAVGNVGYTEAIPQIQILLKAKAKSPAEIALQETARNYLTLLKAKQNTTLEADLTVSQTHINVHPFPSVERDTNQGETSWQSQNRI